jgi:vacuolar-type H+-ATPase subunit B/Vma2
MAKKHHMTKQQYKAYKKNHRQHKYALDVEEEKIRQNRSQYTKYSKKRDEKVRNQLRSVEGRSEDFLDDEFDAVDDLKASKMLGTLKAHRTRLKDLEQYESQ